MRVLIASLLILATSPAVAAAQTASPPVAAPAPAVPPAPIAAPADVGSVDAILAALYGAISGDQGVKRDWDRLRSLLHPDARFIPTGRNAAGEGVARVRTVEQYIASSGPILEGQGFHEIEIHRTTEEWGGLVHVMSTYEGRRTLADPEPMLRGINSIQLFHDGERYWILSIAWSQETPATPIPDRYLPETAQ